jgi:hypothetical protein
VKSVHTKTPTAPRKGDGVTNHAPYYLCIHNQMPGDKQQKRSAFSGANLFDIENSWRPIKQLK